MAAYADLEIELERLPSGGRASTGEYMVQIRFTPAESDADARLSQGGPWLVKLDFDRLRECASDDQRYGMLLAESLFADAIVRTAFGNARRIAQTQHAPLRFRLSLAHDAPELQDLHWEMLCDPEYGTPLTTGEQVLFSRYLSSGDCRPVSPGPKGDLKALAIVANPTDLDSYEPGGRPLAPLNIDRELEPIRSAIGTVHITELASPGQATLDNLIAHLRGGVSLVYLVCHGAFIEGKPMLWLEDEEGRSQVVHGSELVESFRELSRCPPLVILASCQSAGTGGAKDAGEKGALAALGPSMAEAGVPAVLAMKGDVAIQTLNRFMAVLFQELLRDGQIDRAVAAARRSVSDRPDSRSPVLYMRLKSGRIWYEAGFRKGQTELEEWPALLDNIHGGRCTAILGTGLTEFLLGSRRAIARKWAEEHKFPLAPHERDDLPQVAQYVSVAMGQETYPKEHLGEYLYREMLRCYGKELACAMPTVDLGRASPDELISEVGARVRALSPREPHRVLAALPIRIYITTNFSNLLAESLKEAGRDPVVDHCRWYDGAEVRESIQKRDPDYDPSVARPLVYHIFGRLREEDSLVLTEDDYFNFLIRVSSDRDLIPAYVRKAMVASSRLFMGFRMDDWNFRVLFRIMGSLEAQPRSKWLSVAVQVDPEEERIIDVDRARSYLQKYLQKSFVTIYWGKIEDFAAELLKRWEERHVRS